MVIGYGLGCSQVISVLVRLKRSTFSYQTKFSTTKLDHCFLKIVDFCHLKLNTKLVFKPVIIHFLLFSFVVIYTAGKLGFGYFHTNCGCSISNYTFIKFKNDCSLKSLCNEACIKKVNK